MRTAAILIAIACAALVVSSAAAGEPAKSPPATPAATEGYGDIGTAMGGSAEVARIVAPQGNVAREMGLDLTGLISPEAAAAAKKLGEEILAETELEAALKTIRKQ